MDILKWIFLFMCFQSMNISTSLGQALPPKAAYPFDVKQIHSGHSLTDPLFGQPWPGQFVNLLTLLRGTWAEDNVGKSTVPGSSLNWRWHNPVEYGPDARLDISDWELLSITERVPLAYDGGNSQPWYLDLIQEQREYLSLFVNNAWQHGNRGQGASTLLWTTWTNIDDSDGPWRDMLDIQGEAFERMQDYANSNKSEDAPPVYIIPGHKMMARIYDDIALGRVPDITDISQLFSDNIHTNSLGDYAIALIHYACIFNKSPEGLPHDLMPNAPEYFKKPSLALAHYLQSMIWEVVTSYPRTGIYSSTSSNNLHVADHSVVVFPNPVSNRIVFSKEMHAQWMTLTGQIVLDQKNVREMDVSTLPPSLYILILTDSDGQILLRDKIVKE